MPTTHNLLSRNNRQGTHTSSSYNVPAGATGSVIVTGDIAAADLASASNTLSLAVEVYDPISQTWKFNAGFTWRGGAGVGQPRIEWDISDLAGKTVRLVLDIPVQMRVGGTVTVS